MNKSSLRLVELKELSVTSPITFKNDTAGGTYSASDGETQFNVTFLYPALRISGQRWVCCRVPCWRAGRALDPAQGWPSAWRASTSPRTRSHSCWDRMTTPSPGPVSSDLSTEHTHTLDTCFQRLGVCVHTSVCGVFHVPLHKRTVWCWIHRADCHHETSRDTPTEQNWNTHTHTHTYEYDRNTSTGQSEHWYLYASTSQSEHRYSTRGQSDLALNLWLFW